MNTAGITGGNPITDTYGYLNPISGSKSEDNVFVKLLVTQLNNQNPLEPLENNEFIQQMSALASLEETQSLNGNISNLVALQELLAGQNAFTQGASLVGKYVEYTDPATNETKQGLVDSVQLGDNGLFLSINGTDVSMASVTGVLANPTPDAPVGGDSDSNSNSDDGSESGTDENNDNN